MDHEAVEHGKSFLAKRFPKRFQILREDFHIFSRKNHALDPQFDGMLLDLGPSAPQLQTANRGFSFYQTGPLDMRMDQRQGITAEHIIHHFSFKKLQLLFKEFGEIAHPEPVIQSIIQTRKKQKIQTTAALSKIILRHHAWGKRKNHPATPYFLALRIKVNRELEGLKETLYLLSRKLLPGGALAVISFHSLEDRIVKKAFKEFEEKGLGKRRSKKLIRADRAERKSNPSSRSAGLRVFIKEPLNVSKR